MKNRINYFALSALIFTIFFLLTGSLFAGIKDSTSIATVKNLDKYVNIKFNNPFSGIGTYSSGTFTGRINGQTSNFYCIDLGHSLEYNETYTDAGETSSQITYILNNYYPFRTFPYSGSLSKVEQEAAAIQAAIWHFSDSLNVNTIETAAIKNRALAIVNDANLNSGDTRTIKSLVITPLKSKFKSTEEALFVVEAYDQFNNPAKKVTVKLFVNSGTELSSYQVLTDSTGTTAPIKVTAHTGNETIITVQAFVVIPHGTKYVHAQKPDNYQKLVLATPRVDLKEVKAKISWFEDVDLRVYKSVDKEVCGDGEEAVYTINVQNISSNQATNIKVSEALAPGLVLTGANATNGEYSNGIWKIASLNGNQSAQLTIHARISSKDLLANSRSLGVASDFNLFVLEDLTQPSSDTEGKAAIGRDADLANYSVGDKLANSSGTEDVLIVGRKLTFRSGAVLNGNVVYGKFIDVPEHLFGVVDGTIRQDSVLDFNAAAVELKALSNTLAAYEANGNVELMWGGIFLTGNDPLFNVFEVNCSDLSTANDFQIDVPNGAVVIVNFIGDSALWGGGLTVLGTDISNVLYNFSQTAKLTIKGINVTGSILAPFADVNFISGVQNGQMIAKSVSGAGQFNNVKFLGNIPDPVIVNIASVTSLDQIDLDKENDFYIAPLKVSFVKDVIEDETNIEWKETGSVIENEMIWTLSSGNNGTFAGTWGGKVYKSEADGNWNNSSAGINAAFIWSIVQSGNSIFAGTERGVFASSDRGSTWNSVGLDSLDTRTLAIYNGYLYAGTWGYGLFRTSLDSLNNWKLVDLGTANPAIHSLAVDHLNNALLAATFGAGLFRSEDGEVFTNINIGYAHIWTLGVTSAGVVYAGTYGAGLYTSPDGGINWQRINGLSAKYIYSIAVDNNDNVFASSWNKGVFVKLNSGSGFISTGLTTENVSSVSVNSATGEIILGTSSGKIYTGIAKITDVTSSNELPVSFELSQNYPNPFNPSTTIKYSIPESPLSRGVSAGRGVFVTLKIYDMLGREVATLVNEQKSAGKYDVKFDASSIATGVYIYRLTAGDFVSTKKMMLIK